MASPPRSRKTWHPLSKAQQGLWFTYKLQPELRGYFNLALTLRSRPALCPDRLARALESLALRHPMLRARFAEFDGRPYQCIAEAPGATVELVRLPSLDEDALCPRLRADRTRPFDLTAEPPMRATLYTTGEGDGALCLAIDHLVADGWSLFLLARELGALLEGTGETSAQQPQLPEFFDFIEREQEFLQSGRAERHLQYWKQTLSGAEPTFALPTDAAAGTAPWSPTALDVYLPPDLAQGLSALAAEHGTTLAVILLASYRLLLHRLSGQDRIVIGSVAPTRATARLRRAVGHLVNPLALSSTLDSQSTVGQLLRDSHLVQRQSLKHKDVPLQWLVERLLPRRAASGNPFHRAVFAFQSARQAPELASLIACYRGGAAQRWGGYEVAPAGDYLASIAGYDLMLSVIEIDEVVRCSWSYDDRLFQRATVERISRLWLRLLRSMHGDPQRKLSRVPWLDPQERSLLLRKARGQRTDPVVQAPLHRLFEEHARSRPGALAVQCARESLSYGELEARANRLAAALRARGLRAESRVAICMERGTGYVTAILATLKAGAAFVPLDPSYPARRLGYMLQDCSPACVLVDPAGRAALADHGDPATLVDADPQGQAWGDPSGCGLGDVQVSPRDLAYVIYTSGSTGKPKGAMLEHRGLSNLVPALGRLFDVDASSRVLQFVSPSFDASLVELGLALGHGASLHILPRADILPGPPLLKALRQRAITHATLPPSALAVCDADRLPQTMKVLIAGGEALAPAEAQRWSSRVAFYNAYGPTEATVCTLVHRCGHEGSSVPIGRPLPNTSAYVVDDEGELVPPGVTGEILLGGVCVGRGYLNREGLTSERFVPDGFGGRGRLYRTGDLGRYRADGTLEFLGRRDHQVKLRGFRIELGEIEACITQRTEVESAVVCLREAPPHGESLVAYYTGEALSAEALRAHLDKQLPSFMVPAAYVHLERMPLSPTGKIDRARLPMPRAEASDGVARLGQARSVDTSPLERALADQFSQLLNGVDVDAMSNFFALGGHSLLLPQLASAIEAQLGYSVSLRALFEHPTVEDLAAHLEGRTVAAAPLDLRSEVVLDPDIRPDGPAPVAPPTEVLLTGATGFFGAHLLYELLCHSELEVHCLVRGEGQRAALRRLHEVLRRYDLQLPQEPLRRLNVVAADMRERNFGLPTLVYRSLAKRVQSVYHCAAEIDLARRYQDLKATNVGGTREVLRFACLGSPSVVHHISTLSVFPHAKPPSPYGYPERRARAPDALELGYAQSKWVAEELVWEAAARGLPVNVYRPGSLLASRRTGAWIGDDLVCRVIAACVRLGKAPQTSLRLSPLPVDLAARGLVKLSQGPGPGQTYHLVASRSVPVETLIQAARKHGFVLETVAFAVWCDAAREAALGAQRPEWAGFGPLLELLEQAQRAGPGEAVLYDTRNTQAALANGSLEEDPLDGAVLARGLSYLVRIGVLPPQETAADVTTA